MCTLVGALVGPTLDTAAKGWLACHWIEVIEQAEAVANVQAQEIITEATNGILTHC